MKPINIALEEVFGEEIINLPKNQLKLSYLTELNTFDGLIVLISLRNHGKTAFVQDFIVENSVKNNQKGMILFYGLIKDVFLTRLISKLSGIPIELFFLSNRGAELHATDMYEINLAQNAIKKAPLLLDYDCKYQSISDFISKLRDEIEFNGSTLKDGW
jgi:replicative DNA helicase